MAKLKTKHYLYIRYCGMIKRCYNPRHMCFKHYGARGITVCDRWRNDFWAYVEDIERICGPLLDPTHSIDRINNDGNYEPGNVRWATYLEQNRNKGGKQRNPCGKRGPLTPEQKAARRAKMLITKAARETAEQARIPD